MRAILLFIDSSADTKRFLYPNYGLDNGPRSIEQEERKREH